MTADLAPSTALRTDDAGRRNARRVRLLGTLLVALGALMILGGAGAWVAVSQGLASERAMVAEDAPAFAGQQISSPWTAFAQTEAIKGHISAMADGETYATMDQDDPMRDTVAQGTFVRGSLLTSVIAFGVALAVVGTGTGFVLGGLGLRRVAAAH